MKDAWEEQHGSDPRDHALTLARGIALIRGAGPAPWPYRRLLPRTRCPLKWPADSVLRGGRRVATVVLGASSRKASGLISSRTLHSWPLWGFLTFAIAVLTSPVFGASIDFEGFADSTHLTNQIPGLSFTHATILTAGITLNEFEFPPHSGHNVAFDDGGPLSIVFSTAQQSVGGFFTYLEPLTLTAFDAAHNSLGSVHSAFSTNLALSGVPGSTPNEHLELDFAGGITSVIITADPLGSSFTLDDLNISPVPEPSTLLLLGGSLAATLTWMRRRRRGLTSASPNADPDVPTGPNTRPRYPTCSVLLTSAPEHGEYEPAGKGSR